MHLKNDLSKKLRTQFPVIQAPMFGVSTPEMAAAANNAGCLGSLALADLSAEKSLELIQKTKKLTNHDFAVNIFVHHIPEITEKLKSDFSETKMFLENFASENNIQVDLPDFEDIKLNSYHEQIDAVISEKCKILSFTFGNLDSESILKLKNNNVLLIGTCTSVEEAQELENSRIDVICVQGWEAGGHRGSFTSENIPEIGGFSLLAQVSDAVKVPLIYAGGIYSAQTLVAAKHLGASGFQIGSMFLASKESALQNFERRRLFEVKENEIIITKSFSGRFARGIKNQFTETLDSSKYILPYPYQNKLTGALRTAARTAKNADFVNLWLGQSVQNYSEDSTEDILKNFIRDCESL
ncbi:tungsten formylmethanofuran dehydrogenase [Chryseobacterium sp. Leaf404]|uniref:NAD(P)H-dependent flavin oxidoreductase n=1 Tax=unclassified Chryseobacterium TaxID=2593645 RepID=UPI0006FD97D1|nr:MULTISPECIES: nitronate monooxygenase [unclassified Chryseobacterium]KQT17006.1 tungsten formylmethanofuran dehydrogenase [Chryseobacterium sp. Leaf404]